MPNTSITIGAVATTTGPTDTPIEGDSATQDALQQEEDQQDDGGFHRVYREAEEAGNTGRYRQSSNTGYIILSSGHKDAV